MCKCTECKITMCMYTQIIQQQHAGLTNTNIIGKG